MDTWAIMSQIQCGPTTLLEVYLQRLETRERRETLLPKYLKACARYAQTHSSSDSDTDDENNEGEPGKKRSRSEKKVEETNKRRKNVRQTEELSSEDDKNDSDGQAQGNKVLNIQKVSSENGNVSTNEQEVDQKTSTPDTADDSETEIIDVCTF